MTQTIKGLDVSEYFKWHYKLNREKILARKRAYYRKRHPTPRVVMTKAERDEKNRARALAAYRKNPSYYRKYAAERYAAFRQVLIAVKTENGCKDCGIKDHRVLDFDHVGPKEFNLAKGDGVSREKLLAEIAKCEIRCANCHRLKTWV